MSVDGLQAERYEAHIGAGRLASARGDYSGSAEHFPAGLALQRELGDQRGVGAARN
jgi:hypothetical protein